MNLQSGRSAAQLRVQRSECRSGGVLHGRCSLAMPIYVLLLSMQAGVECARAAGATCNPPLLPSLPSVGYPPCHDACTYLSYLAPPGLADPYCDKDKREHSQWFYFRVSNCADETLNVSCSGLDYSVAFLSSPPATGSYPQCRARAITLINSA